MEERTPAMLALGRSYDAVDGVHFDVMDVGVEHRPDRRPALTYRLSVTSPGRPAERWEVTLPWDTSFTDVLVSMDPSAERLQLLVHLFRTELEEWWDTKGRERRVAKLGRRLP